MSRTPRCEQPGCDADGTVIVCATGQPVTRRCHEHSDLARAES